MKKTIWLLIFIFCNVPFIYSTDYPSNKFGEGMFVLQGKVFNKPSNMNSIEFSISDYSLGEQKSIIIQPDGSFKSSFPITDIQDIQMELNNQTICFFTFPKDTITFSFDANNPTHSFSFKGSTPERTKELELNLLLSRKINYLSFYAFYVEDDVLEEEKISILTSQFNSYIELINTFITENGEITSSRKLIEDIYYAMANEACRTNIPLALLTYNNPYDPIYEIKKWDAHDSISNLKLTKAEKELLFNKYQVIDTIPRKRPYEKLDYNTFRYSSNYRTFLDHYFIKDRYYEVDGIDDSFEWVPDIKSIYYSCLAYLPIVPIRDWLITRRLNFHFSSGDFKDVEEVYLDFKKKNRNKEYAKLLEKRYLATKPLHVSKLAPDFELEDLNGNKVRLSDFRGKIVYIDFWGTYCSPCISEFENSVPLLKEKYKKTDIVYVYICIGSDKEQWKKSVKKYGLEGVNLIVDGGVQSSVCQTYNIQGVPHYVLINKKGEIEEHSAMRPSQILHSSQSKFDQLANDNKEIN